MGKPTKNEAERTAQLIRPPSPVEGSRTWLGHLADGESGLIDLMVLKGKYTVDQIADQLAKNDLLKEKSLKEWIKRVEAHLAHLSTVDGDSKNKASGVGGHNLSIKEEAGKVLFDY